MCLIVQRHSNWLAFPWASTSRQSSGRAAGPKCIGPMYVHSMEGIACRGFAVHILGRSPIRRGRLHRSKFFGAKGGAVALNSKVLLCALVMLSLTVGAYEAALFRAGYHAGLRFQATWSLVFLVLLVLWVDMDCRKRKNIYRPYEFGFLVFLFWLPYLPYYLLRTRQAWGLVWLIGFAMLFYCGYWLQWIVYLAR